MRLKSRTKFPPGGFQAMVPQAGMKAPFSGSFSEAVNFLHNFRRKNPALVEKNGWSLNIQDIERDVEEYNAQRMVAHGWLNFVELEGEPASVPKTSPSMSRSGGRVVDGLRLITEWIGSGKKPVAKDAAEQRASVCVTCPKNGGGDWKSYFTKAAADKIRYLLGVKHDLDLNTSQDEKLQICTACDCVLSLKVWTPFDLIKANTSDDVWNNLHERCWMLEERKKS